MKGTTMAMPLENNRAYGVTDLSRVELEETQGGFIPVLLAGAALLLLGSGCSSLPEGSYVEPYAKASKKPGDEPTVEGGVKIRIPLN